MPADKSSLPAPKTTSPPETVDEGAAPHRSETSELETRTRDQVVIEGAVLAVGALAAVALIAVGVLLVTGSGKTLELLDVAIKILFGLAGLGGVYAALRRALAQDRALAGQERQLELARAQFEHTQEAFRAEQAAAQRRAADEAYASAVANLGSDNPMTRAGAIYAIEAVVRQFPEYQPTAIEVLTAFLRGRGPKQEEELRQDALSARTSTPRRAGEQLLFPTGGKLAPGRGAVSGVRPLEDVQAAIAVIGRRDAARDNGSLDFTGAFLGAVDFRRGNFAGAVFVAVWMEGAVLHGANLKKAYFWETQLRGALLTGADLSGARFYECNVSRTAFDAATLTKATFEECRLHDAEFGHATMARVKFEDSDLSEANFNDANLERARISRCDVRCASFEGARMGGARLMNLKNLVAPQLTGASVEGGEPLVEPPI